MGNDGMRDLNDLNFFAAVVAHGGFSAASRALDAPKSRISRRVAALEGQLGVRLIERSTRRFKVTEVGQDVYRHARAALTEADAIDEVVTRLKAEPQGLVRLSCPMGVDRLLGNCLPQFLAQNSRLRVQVIVTNRRIDLIEEGVDIAIRIREKLDTDGGLQMKVIARTGYVLAASPGFVAERGQPSTPAEVASFPTLGQNDRPGLDRWTLINGAGEEAEVTHEPRLASSSFQIVRQAVLDGVGIALLPEYVVRELIDAGRIVQPLPDWVSPQGIFHLVFTSRRGQLPGVRAVIDFVAEALRPGSLGWQGGER
jgi:DNA-binding transcriptional LysR family regulator